MNTGRSARLHAEALTLTPGGVSSPVRAFAPHPIAIDKAEGCRLTDIDGNVYTDLCMAYGPPVAGHACPAVVAAVREQIGRGGVYGAPSEPEYALIRRIRASMPAMESVRLCGSGTEATMHAIRLARGCTGRDGIIKMEGGFHGAHDAVLVAAGSGSAQCTPGSRGVPAAAVGNTYSVGYNDLDAATRLLEAGGIACVIVEPVMGNVGTVLPERGYLQGLRKATEEHGALLVFDEVITGFRLAEGGAREVYGVTPDLATLGKAIGGGLPIGAFGGRRDLMENIAPAGDVYAAGTFAGNPVSAAAGLAQLEYMRADGRYARLNRTADAMVRGLGDVIADRGTQACVSAAGSMVSVFFGLDAVRDGAQAQRADRQTYMELFRHMLGHGIYMPPSALETSFLSAAHTEAETAQVVEAFDGFLGARR